MLHLILGGAGCGKSRRMLELIRECAENGGSPCIFVPEQFSLEYDNKLYDALGAVYYNLVEANGFSRFAKQIFLRYGTVKGRYADEISRAAVMYLTLKNLSGRGALEFYANRMRTGAFVPLMLDTIKDLELAAVKPERLLTGASSPSGDIQKKAQDIALIHMEYSRVLKQKGLKDALTDIEEAALIAEKNGYFKGKTVFIDEYKSFTADELKIIASAFDAENIYAAFDTEDSESLLPVFATVNNTCAVLSRLAGESNVAVRREILSAKQRFRAPELIHLSDNILRPVQNGSIRCGAVRIIEANDPYEECDYVCAEMHRLIREEGYKYSEIAVISRKLEDYRGIFESAASRYDLTIFMNTEKSVFSSALIRLVSNALAFAGSVNISTDLMLETAKTRLAGISPAEAEILEIYCFRHNIENQAWLSPFDAEENDTAESIRKTLIEPLLKFKNAVSQNNAAEICEKIYQYLIDTAAEHSLLSLITSLKENAQNEEAENLRLTWRGLMEILDKLHTVLGSEPMRIKDFAEIFAISAASSEFASPPQVLDCVTVTRMQSARLSNPRAVFIIGANEGFFPKYTEAGGLFSERDKRRLLTSGIALSNTAEQMISNESFVVYTAVSTASEKLYISYPLIDAAGTQCREAVTLHQIKKLFTDTIHSKASDMPMLFYSSTPAAAYYQYVRNYFSADPQHEALREALLQDSEYAPRIRYLDKINKRAAEKLPPELARECYGTALIVSNSRLEAYSKCAFMHFCKYALRLYPLTSQQLDALARGSIVHHCVHMLFRECGCKQALLRLSADEIRKRIKKYAADYVRENIPSAVENAAQRLKYEKIASGAEFLSLQLCRELEQTRFDFNANSVEAPLSALGFTLPGGASLTFTGTIDRMDSCMINGEKYIRILDYKTGEKKFSLNTIPEGINLQLLIYLLTQTQAHSAKPAGMLYVPAAMPKISLPRGSSSEEHQKHISAYYRMDGLILQDYDVVSAMEERFGNADSSCVGEHIPVSLNKDGSFSKKSKLIPENILETVRGYVYDLITREGTEILDGNISPQPLKDACSYCDYTNICRGFGEITVRDTAAEIENFKQMILGEKTE